MPKTKTVETTFVTIPNVEYAYQVAREINKLPTDEVTGLHILVRSDGSCIVGVGVDEKVSPEVKRKVEEITKPWPRVVMTLDEFLVEPGLKFAGDGWTTFSIAYPALRRMFPPV